MSSRELAAVSRIPTEARDSQAGPWGPAPPGTDDALAGLALEYTTRSLRLVTTRSAEQAVNGPTDARPTPVEIVLWFHSRIYFKTMRALVGQALTGAGAVDRFEDPRVCAKQTLIAVDRSRAALTQLRGEDVERTALLALLDAIARGIEERFGCGRVFAGTATDRRPGAGPSTAGQLAPDRGATRTEILRTNKKPASLLKRAVSTETP